MSTALFIGRFQPLHEGHWTVLEQIAQDNYDEVIIGIGSSQYAGTADNPWSAAERQVMLETVLRTRSYPLAWRLVCIPDIHDPQRWVAHVDACVQTAYDVVYTGNAVVKALFVAAQKRVQDVQPSIAITATQLRQWLIDSDEQWKAYVPAEIHSVVLSRRRVSSK